MIRVIYVGSYDCEPKYIVAANQVIKEYPEQLFISLLCKPHKAEYNLQYLDYGMEDDTIQCYIENMMECKEAENKLTWFNYLWDYLMGEVF